RAPAPPRGRDRDRGRGGARLAVVPPARVPQQLRLRRVGRAGAGLSRDRGAAEARPGGVRARVRGVPRAAGRVLLGLDVHGRSPRTPGRPSARAGEADDRARPPVPLGLVAACEGGPARPQGCRQASSLGFPPMGAQGPPVFVGGINRSGTTLMACILGSSSVLALPPSEFLFFGKGAASEPRDRTEFERRLAEILAWPRVREWGLDEREVVARSRSWPVRSRSLFLLPLDAYRHRLGKPRLGEKSVLGLAGYDLKENSSFAAAESGTYEGAIRRGDAVDRRAAVHLRERLALAALCGAVAHSLGYELDRRRPSVAVAAAWAAETVRPRHRLRAAAGRLS